MRIFSVDVDEHLAFSWNTSTIRICGIKPLVRCRPGPSHGLEGFGQGDFRRIVEQGPRRIQRQGLARSGQTAPGRVHKHVREYVIPDRSFSIQLKGSQTVNGFGSLR